MISWIGAARAAMASAAQPADRDRRIDAIVREASVGLSDLLHSTVTLALSGFPDAETGPWAKPAPPPSPTDRQEAPALWEALRRRTPSERLLLVDELQRFRHWALCELLCDESVRAAAPTPPWSSRSSPSGPPGSCPGRSSGGRGSRAMPGPTSARR
jgi:hypothetical protein